MNLKKHKKITKQKHSQCRDKTDIFSLNADFFNDILKYLNKRSQNLRSAGFDSRDDKRIQL